MIFIIESAEAAIAQTCLIPDDPLSDVRIVFRRDAAPLTLELTVARAAELRDALADLLIQYANVAEFNRIRTEERERCAQIAESFIPSGFREQPDADRKGGTMIGVVRDDRARVIAAAIRVNVTAGELALTPAELDSLIPKE